jgi:hypothetical protein
MPQFIFRKPKYPLLIETDSLVKSACNGTELSKVVKKYEFSVKNDYKIIDVTSEGWVYHADKDLVSPMVFGNDKRWTKARIVELYNSAKDKLGEAQYVTGSISNKRVDRIIEEIAAFEGKP